MGAASVSRVDTAATRDVVINVAPCAVRRCSANSFWKSNLLCAWLDAEDRASTAQKQATRVVIRAAAGTPRRCGDGSLRRIVISLANCNVLFSDCPWVRTLAHRERIWCAIQKTGRVQRSVVILLPSYATVNGTGVLTAYTSSSQATSIKPHCLPGLHP